jgi:hypothetical protein
MASTIGPFGFRACQSAELSVTPCEHGMRYDIKPTGSLTWNPLDTESLAGEVEHGRIRGDWKIRRENDSRDYTVSELCRIERGLRGEQATAKGDSSPDATTDSGTDTPRPQLKLFYFLSLCMIVDFLWSTLTAAHEYDSRELVYFTIGLDVLMVVGLIATQMQIFRTLPEERRPWVGGTVMFLVALIAGLGLLAIRMNGDSSWWTGHLRYELLP